MKQLLSQTGTLYCSKSQRLYEAQDILELISEKESLLKDQGIQGLKVSLVARSDIHFVTQLLALLSNQCGILLLSPQETPAQKKAFYREYPCSFELGESITDLNQRISSSTAELSFTTSGTTGLPKIINCSAEDLQKKINFLRPSFSEDELKISASVLNLSFGHGLIGTLLFPLLTGNRVVLIEPQLEQLLQAPLLLKEQEVSFISATPHTYRILTQYLEVIPSFKRVQIASALFDEKLISSLKAMAPQAKIINAYGLTEFFSWVSFHEITQLREPNIISLPSQGILQDAEGRINQEEGEIFISEETSPHWQRINHRFIHQGKVYLGTHDIVKRTEEGYQILYRKDDLISVNAIKFYPQEVELFFRPLLPLRNFYFIHLSELHCNVLLIEGHEDHFLQDRLEKAALTLPLIKRPARIIFYPQLPSTARGKVSRKELQVLCLAVMKS